MPSLGPMELLVVLGVALLVLGPDKLPAIARRVGQAVSQYGEVRERLRGGLDLFDGADDRGSVASEPAGGDRRDNDPLGQAAIAEIQSTVAPPVATSHDLVARFPRENFG